MATSRRATSRRSTSPVTELEQVGERWDYAPAPESREIVQLQARYGHYIGGEWLEATETLHDDRAVHRGAARGGRPGHGRRRRRRRRRRARGVPGLGRAAPGRAREVPVPDRAHPPGALARARGARVAQRRQADQGVARRRPAARRRPLLLLRGLGRQARVRVPELDPQGARRRGADHPVELPAPDAVLEDRARACGREHRGAQAGRDDAADGALLLRRSAPGRAAARASSTSSPATAARAPRWSSTPGSTRSRSPARPRWARRSSAQLAGTGKRLTLELGGKAANIVFDDCALDQAVEGIVNGIYFNQGHVCCAGSRLLRAGVDRRAGDREAEAAARHTPRRRPARQEHRRRRDQLARSSSRRSGSSSPPARRRAPRSTSRSAASPRRATGSRRRCSRTSRRATASRRRRSSARCSRCSPSAPRRRRSRRPTTRLRALRRRLDGEGLAHPLDGRAPACRRRLGEHLQPLRPRFAVRRLQGVRLRPRGRPARARALPGAGRMSRCRSRRRTSCSSAAPSRAPSRAAPTRPRARTSPAPRARTFATPSSRPARRCRSGPARPRTTAARCSTASPR